MYRKEKFLCVGTTVILSEMSRTITGRGRGFWNVEEGGTIGKKTGSKGRPQGGL